MNTKIKINKLAYSLNRQEIERRYMYFALETSDKYIKRGAYILDATSLDSNIKSVCFESGRKALIMMEQSEECRVSLKNLIGKVEGGSSLSIIDVKVSDIPDNVLVQLMLNALSSYDSNILKFNKFSQKSYR